MTSVGGTGGSPPTADDASHEASEEALRWIVRLHSGTATEADRQGFATWRQSSKAHERAATEAEALWEDLSHLHFDARRNLIQPGQRPKAVTRRKLMRASIGLAGLGLLGGAFWNSGLLQRASADYTSSAGELRTIELPDGSRLVLNGRSAVNLVFEPAIRSLELLDGQVFVEVAADPMRPFQVLAEGISITALGTAFDVSRNLPGALAEVAVTEHAVRVSNGPSGGASVVEVAAGERLTIAGTDRLGRPVKQDVAVTTAWQDGMYVANDRPLTEVIAALSAWHPGLIFTSGGSLASLRVNAVLDLRDPAGSLDALADGLPVRVTHVSRFLAIVSAT